MSGLKFYENDICKVPMTHDLLLLAKKARSRYVKNLEEKKDKDPIQLVEGQNPKISQDKVEYENLNQEIKVNEEDLNNKIEATRKLMQNLARISKNANGIADMTVMQKLITSLEEARKEEASQSIKVNELKNKQKSIQEKYLKKHDKM